MRPAIRRTSSRRSKRTSPSRRCTPQTSPRGSGRWRWKTTSTFYRFRHGIDDAKLESDRATVQDALDRIERERQGRAYLVGDAFAVADLTAAALLSPLLQPAEIQYPMRVAMPRYLQDYRAALLAYPAARWAAGIYRQHRGASAEVRGRSTAA